MPGIRDEKYSQLNRSVPRGHNLDALCDTAFSGRPGTACVYGMLLDEMPPRGGFIPAETLVQNGAAAGTLHQPVLVILIG